MIVDASFKYDIDNREEFERMLKEGKIKQCPADTDANYFLLEIAQEKEAMIINNDQYERIS